MIKGDRVMRIAGTSVGFRVRTHHTIEDVSRTHIKVRNADGQVSPWFLRGDFMWIGQGNKPRVVLYTVLALGANGNFVETKSFFSGFNANRHCDHIRAEGGTVLAKKRITIAHDQPQARVGG